MSERSIGTVRVYWPDECLHDPACTREPWPWTSHSVRCAEHNGLPRSVSRRPPAGSHPERD